MNEIKTKAQRLDEHIPDYVLGRADTRLCQQIEEHMQHDPLFAKQVRVEQALVADIAVETRRPETDSEAVGFDRLQQRINDEDVASGTNTPQKNAYLPAIAAAFLLAAIALPLLMQSNNAPNNQFEALSESQPAQALAVKNLRVIFSEEISAQRRSEIASDYNLEVIEAAGALNSVLYKLPSQAPAKQLLKALQQEEAVEFATLTSAAQ